MAAYFAGGFLADRYPANRLMTVALIATAAGGVVLRTGPRPGIAEDSLRLLGPDHDLSSSGRPSSAPPVYGEERAPRGRAYGILDGGRGLFAALMASLGVWIFAAMLPVEAASASLDERTAALLRTVWVFTVITVVAALLVWLAVPAERRGRERPAERPIFTSAVLRMPSVWVQALIVLCAYVGYKSGDDFGLWARDAFGYDDVASARLATVSFWIRPIAALGAGLLADRLRASRVMVLCFAILAVGSLSIASGWLTAGLPWLIASTVAVTAIGLHSLRGVYFAVMDEAGIPWALTGSAVGGDLLRRLHAGRLHGPLVRLPPRPGRPVPPGTSTSSRSSPPSPWSVCSPPHGFHAWGREGRSPAAAVPAAWQGQLASSRRSESSPSASEPLRPCLKFFRLSPTAPPSFGSFEAPKSTTTIRRMISSSCTPRPAIRLSPIGHFVPGSSFDTSDDGSVARASSPLRAYQ